MKTSTFSSAYNDWIAHCGLDLNSPHVDVFKSRFLSFFNARLRTIWRSARWPFLVKTASLYVCKFGVVVLPKESDLDTSDKFEMYDSDPRLGWKAKNVPYKFDGANLNIGENLISTLDAKRFDSLKSYDDGDCFEQFGIFYVRYGNSNIQLSGNLIAEDFIFSESFKSLSKGDCVLSSDEKKFIAYVCTTDVENIEDFESTRLVLKSVPFKKTAYLKYKPLEPEFTAEDSEKTFPYAFKSYIIEGARASWVASENRNEEERTILESIANDILEEELLRLEKNPNMKY